MHKNSLLSITVYLYSIMEAILCDKQSETAIVLYLSMYMKILVFYFSSTVLIIWLIKRTMLSLLIS